MELKSATETDRSRQAAKNLLEEMDKILADWVKLAPDPPPVKKNGSKSRSGLKAASKKK